MRTADFDFGLPPELIAQTPAEVRDASRLLVLHRGSGKLEHRRFGGLVELLQAGDVLVLNNSRVIPARLRGANVKTSGRFELLLLEENAPNDWWVMLRPGKRARIGTSIVLSEASGNPVPIHATVLETNPEGHRRLRFKGTANILNELDRLGEVPLPPYINRAVTDPADRERYQTVFAQPSGSVAAPTAGLHFTEALLAELRTCGVKVCFVTLHVGLGTFAPVKAESLAGHTMHEERFDLSEETARLINAAKREGRRVIAVGTTTMRVLETAAREEIRMNSEIRIPSSEIPGLLVSEHPASSIQHPAPALTQHATRNTQHAIPALPPALVPGAGRTRIFIYPPYHFRVADALLTNFHLPRSTLLMLVSAFAAPDETRGRELVLSAYAEAIRERYRFFSYGDAMLLL